MNPYDQEAWEQIGNWKQRRQKRRVRNVVPRKVRERAGEHAQALKGFVETAPGVETIEVAITNALQGLGEALRDVAVQSLRRGAIIRAYEKHGHPVNELRDIKRLELA